MRVILRLLSVFLFLCLPTVAFAAEQSFSDIPANHPHFAAAEYLKAHGILQGYDDGTFKPDQAVNRAEVMKIIVLQRTPQIALGVTASGTSFTDVAIDAWYGPYVEHAYKELRLIDGPPLTKTFGPERQITRAEFLKMLLLAYDVDPQNSFSELTFPLAGDVTDPKQWYYPFVRYALTASMLTAQKGNLEPGVTLSRGDIATMLYRFLLYREGKQTQTLLSTTENEMLTALRLLESDAIDSAREASGRAILAARGALVSQPQDGDVKAAVKVAEGSMALIDARNEVLNGKIRESTVHASTAWHLGEKAKSFSSSFNALVEQLQESAAKVADEARTLERPISP